MAGDDEPEELDLDKTVLESWLYMIPCKSWRYSSLVVAEARKAAVWALRARNLDYGWWSMTGADWFFCNHSITVLELLDSAAKKSHHFGFWIYGQGLGVHFGGCNHKIMNIPMEQKILYRKWKGKKTSFLKEKVENFVWNGDIHFQPGDGLWGSQWQPK